MLDLLHSRLYAKPADVDLLKTEPEYVKNRYFTIIKTLIDAPFRWTRQQAADNLHLSKRYFYVILSNYRSAGIPGLRLKSRRPKTMPNKSPKAIETAVVAMKELTGLGSPSISALVNEQFRIENRSQKVGPSLAYNICVRNDLITPPTKKPTAWKSLDWKRPNNLIQSDLTQVNGIPILTMEDDHSRHGWSDVIDDECAETVSDGMRKLIPYKFNNLLTDNGRQFSKKNLFFCGYLKRHVLKDHIHSSIRHPQTLGKLSAYQKGVKNFLRYKLGDSCNRLLAKVLLKAYNLFYNNGRFHRGAKGIPAEIYSGKRDENWFTKMMRILKAPSYKSLCSYG
jgi:hypothetical protein